jgi:hypothetical protein
VLDPLDLRSILVSLVAGLLGSERSHHGATQAISADPIVLDVMGEAAATTSASLTEIRVGLDLLHGRVACIDTTQQQLVAQIDLIGATVQDDAELHADAARQFALLDARITAINQGMERLRARSPSLEEDVSNLDERRVTGTSTQRA